MKLLLLLFVLVNVFKISSASANGIETIKYYDNLKTCTPYTFSYPHPIVPGFVGKNIINGKKGDKCSVKYIMPENMNMNCEFTTEAISLMTSEAKYKEAMGDTASGSSSDPASKKMQEECKIEGLEP